jgi:glycosyltransferase involved in cell wall biosynthesis
MKVLMLTDYFYPHVGGVEKVVLEISKRLSEMGCKVAVLTLNIDKKDNFENLGSLGIHRTAWSINLSRVIGVQLAVSLSAPFRLLKVVKTEKPDVIHANNRFFFTTMLAVLLKRIMNRPLVTTLHIGPVPSGGVMNWLISIYEKVISKIIVNHSDKIIAVSIAVKNHAIFLGAAPSKVVVIPNGVDLDEFVPRLPTDENESTRDDNDKIKVLFVGRLIYDKGVQCLIEAAPKILAKNPHVEFVLVGEGPLERKLRKLAQHAGVMYAFEFAGTSLDVAGVMKACNVFVLPSMREGGRPLVVMEAMACGLPVIVTRVPGIDEIITNNQDGILIDINDSQALADAVLRVIDDREFFSKLGRNARRSAEQNCAWEKTARSVLEVYERLLKMNA